MTVCIVFQVPTPSSHEHFWGPIRRQQWRASCAALVIALLVHMAVIVLLPDQLLVLEQPSAPPDEEVLELTLVPPEALRFVEANPEVPENEPDRKDQYSFRAQQAADQSPTESLLSAPQVEGEEASQKIVQGASQLVVPLAPGLYTPEQVPGDGEGRDGGQAGGHGAVLVPFAAPLPAPPFMQAKPMREDGSGSRLETFEVTEDRVDTIDPHAPIRLYQPEQANTQIQAQQPGDGAGGALADKPMPRERPTLAPELIHGPLMRSEGSAHRRGALAIDATFSEFGEYEQQFYAALQAGWYQEIDFFQPIDTSARVVVSFRIESDGSIHDVRVLHSTASQIATLICQTALTKRSPFRPWTKEMMQVFGKERELEVSFHYR